MDNNIITESVNWQERFDALVAKAKERGAIITADFIDYEHLHCFWYDENRVIKVAYRNYTVELDVYGEIRCDINGNRFVKPENGKPMYQEGDIKALIANDDVLDDYIKNGTITFDSNNWISAIIVDENGEAICEPEDSIYSNLVLALEDLLFDYLDYIDEEFE